MKFLLLGFALSISIVSFSSVNPGQYIKSELINKILDIKVPTGENIYVGVMGSPTVNGPVTVSHQNIPNWITCNRVATGAVVCTFSAPDLLNLTTDMNCQTQIAANSFTNAYMVSVGNNSQDGITLRSSSGGAASDNIAFWLQCVRTGSDFYQMKTIRQIIQEAGFVF